MPKNNISDDNSRQTVFTMKQTQKLCYVTLLHGIYGCTRVVAVEASGGTQRGRAIRLECICSDNATNSYSFKTLYGLPGIFVCSHLGIEPGKL